MSVLISKAVLGYMSTNCYLIKDTESGKALLIDPALFDNRLVSMLKKENIEKLEYILLTHGHFDHILGVNDVKKNYGGKIVIHSLDEVCFTDDERSLLSDVPFPMRPPQKSDITVNDGDTLMLGKTKITVMHTPGHTAGSVCYIFDDFIISGDTLFSGSVGRTDFVSGSMEQMKSSLKRLASLTGHYKVFPGHGEATTLEYEKQNNLYFR